MYAYILLLEDLKIVFRSGFPSYFEAECAALDMHEDYRIKRTLIVEV